VVLLKDGHIEQVGSPEELYARPATAFTASFIGRAAMNLLRLNGTATLTGVRPEDIRLGGEGLEAVVESVEYLGADSLVAARAVTQPLLVRVRPFRGARRRDRPRRLDSGHEHHFDAHSGRRRQ
jgi:sn-glycerol 3-phosphate transport system ATP-binding protein